MKATTILTGLCATGLLTFAATAGQPTTSAAPSDSVQPEARQETQERRQRQRQGDATGQTGQTGQTGRTGQEGERKGKDKDRPADGAGPGGRRGPMSPLYQALDKNHNGILSKAEIKHASASLLTLDKNGDGSLNPREIFGRGGPGNGAGPDGPRRGKGDKDAKPGTKPEKAGGVTPRRPPTRRSNDDGN